MADSDGACLYLCSVMCTYGVKLLCATTITKIHSSHVGMSVMITVSVGINTMALLCIVKFLNKSDGCNSSRNIIIMIMIGKNTLMR